jgi:hypothetical protein
VVGWTKTENIAMASRIEFTDHINMEQFLTVISKGEMIDGRYLDMGARIKLKRENNDSYLDELPEIDRTGSIRYR